MSFTFFHEFNELRSSFECFPALRQVPTLAELADRLWNLEPAAGKPAALL